MGYGCTYLGPAAASSGVHHTRQPSYGCERLALAASFLGFPVQSIDDENVLFAMESPRLGRLESRARTDMGPCICRVRAVHF